MSDYHLETHQVGDFTVKIYQDPDPMHPDEGSDDLFLVSFSSDFHVIRKGTWEDVGDFRDFIHPRYQVDGWDPEKDLPEPLIKPVRGPEDPIWRAVYAEKCSDQMEQLLLASGEESDFSNQEGAEAANEDWDLRSDIWQAWQSYKAAHAEWACFVVRVNNYGGGNMSVSLQEIYDGSETDRWGNPKDVDGFVMVKKSAGWHSPPLDVADDLIKEWQAYLDGEVYGYVVEDETGNQVDSCWGFLADQEECLAQGIDSAKWYDEHSRKQLKLPLPLPVAEEVQDGC
jgi:hypothetical protein